MAGAEPMNRHNDPTGWAAFRALRQAPSPAYAPRHGNWRHGMRSKAGIAAMRRVRLATRVWKMRPRQLLAIPAEVFDAWFPLQPSPVGWRAYQQLAARDRSELGKP